ncbi:HalOD1 output domain-containing protein [Natronobacterium gregoryi]|uniref:Halobacterial output domain-containing protein n=2 Tax=Natronobacterium gregoryi TaxID=44930 RepID=L0ANV9_NATGS|nr:HalOD1 output domain-containing protein [Natronobacterium gregoryi]AFZ74912.1 hypothetical protein Natgr_3818 [Natronobacterium gregoryi SP2]ELY67390.1 hypothetical protein C490_11081 [Natronobacterium gregoryi SP2]PLK19841.1 hypothetical protein CYV19_12565 [Natronobacterium gregoryi SP2]SFJ39008.1 hypothetical protein SAMN05443661_1269 [Natronobacterium gregoryi]
MAWGERPSAAVVETIAQAEGVDPMTFEPSLYQAIDPDALDTLIESADGEVTVVFTFAGYTVGVDGTGTVTLAPIDETETDDESSGGDAMPSNQP